jgi:hypothetical protein
MAIKMKKSDLAIAWGIVAAILVAIVVGFASCQNVLPDDVDSDDSDDSVDSGPTVTVTAVTVSPGTATVLTGNTHAFTTSVTGTGSPAQSVTWSIDGTPASGTSITQGGSLTVAAGETAATLTIRATSTVDTAQSGTAAVTVTAPAPDVTETAPTVTGVTVSPGTASVVKGNTQTFTAIVAGTNSPAQTVNWSIDGTHAAGTGITGGNLTVAAGETAATLTIRATSTVDTAKSGTAAVAVSAAAHTIYHTE